jgi:hypothetical protein
MKKQAQKKPQKIDREVVENAMLDTVRLRAALMLACTELCGGDPLEGWGLAEEFYDLAPRFIEGLTGGALQNLPAKPADILQFPNKTQS